MREHLKAQRAQLTKKQNYLTSQVIAGRAFDLIDRSNVKNLHVYLPIDGLGEINTLPLIQTIKQKNPEARMAASLKKGKNVSTYWLDEKLQPVEKVLGDTKFDMVIVPMLGFDEKGHRLGYGGGFYDEFLAKQPQSKTVGLCYESGKIDGLPYERHDVPLNCVVTEKKIYKFGNKF